eukprot:TRINITY_DN3821_c0_g1_i1.p1 TRINITY_DN3821_c0_g1~~TRINITY_DN3821_c0_g1_i1.p1  ORF type:complete len:409 (-),score=95.95 TRINITY_DN3821_c0_g1_i1:705-1931(-)
MVTLGPSKGHYHAPPHHHQVASVPHHSPPSAPVTAPASGPPSVYTSPPASAAPARPSAAPRDSPPARPGTGAKIYVANLPAGMRDGEFKALFDRFGPIVRATLVKRRRTTTFGFLQFATREMAAAAVAAMNGAPLDVRTLTVQFADGERDPAPPPSPVLRVSNLPAPATRSQLDAIFSRFGTIVACHVEKAPGQLANAIVEFATAEAAAAAQETLHCLCFPNQDPPLEVEFLKAPPDAFAHPKAQWGGGNPAGRPLEWPPTGPPHTRPAVPLRLRDHNGFNFESPRPGAPPLDADGWVGLPPLAEYLEDMRSHYHHHHEAPAAAFFPFPGETGGGGGGGDPGEAPLSNHSTVSGTSSGTSSSTSWDASVPGTVGPSDGSASSPSSGPSGADWLLRHGPSPPHSIPTHV